VAVVTGANKGIGYEIVRKLAAGGMTVVLTARDEGRGLKACGDLHAENLKNVVFHKLDVANPDSVTEFVNWLTETYHGLDILVSLHLSTYPFHISILLLVLLLELCTMPSGILGETLVVLRYSLVGLGWEYSETARVGLSKAFATKKETPILCVSFVDGV